jgi:hypothetical protein
MMAETGETERAIASTVTVTEPDFVESDIEVAVMFTGKVAVGGVDGAVYVTEVPVGLLRVPPPDAGEVMIQELGLTPAFAGSKLTVAVICEAPVACTEKGFAERETAMAAKVIPMDPDFVGSLAEVAPMTTCTSADGGVAGAVYVTLVLVGLLRVPAPVAGLIVQEAGLTPLFAGSLPTVAVICDVPAAPTGLTDAVMETKMGGTSMFRVFDFVGSDTEVPVIVTDRSLGGGVAGALYVAEKGVVLLKLPAPEAGSMLHVTPLFAGSPAALPVSATVPPASTWLAAADMDTVMFGGGGGGGVLLPQPVMIVTETKPDSKRVRTNLLFTGPPERSGLGTPGNLQISPKTNFTGLRKETIRAVIHSAGIYLPGISPVALRPESIHLLFPTEPFQRPHWPHWPH